MARYHINPETGRPNICRAKTPDACKYAKDGETVPHYDTKEEARAGYEKEMSGETISVTSLADPVIDNGFHRRESARAVFQAMSRLRHSVVPSSTYRDLLRAVSQNDTESFDRSVQSIAEAIDEETRGTMLAEDPEFSDSMEKAKRDNGTGGFASLVVDEDEQELMSVADEVQYFSENGVDVVDGESLCDQYVPEIMHSFLAGNGRDAIYSTYLLSRHARDNTSSWSFEWTRSRLSELHDRARRLYVKSHGEEFVRETEKILFDE